MLPFDKWYHILWYSWFGRRMGIRKIICKFLGICDWYFLVYRLLQSYLRLSSCCRMDFMWKRWFMEIMVIIICHWEAKCHRKCSNVKAKYFVELRDNPECLKNMYEEHFIFKEYKKYCMSSSNLLAALSSIFIFIVYIICVAFYWLLNIKLNCYIFY